MALGAALTGRMPATAAAVGSLLAAAALVAGPVFGAQGLVNADLFEARLREKGVATDTDSLVKNLGQNADAEVRASSARLLGFRHEMAGMDALRKAAENDKSWTVREAADMALSRLGDKQALSALQELRRRSLEAARAQREAFAKQSPDLIHRFEFEPGFSVGGGALALVGILVTARCLRGRRSTIASLGLVACVIGALAWFTNAWMTYEVRQTSLSMFAGLDYLVLIAIAVVPGILVFLSLAERWGRER